MDRQILLNLASGRGWGVIRQEVRDAVRSLLEWNNIHIRECDRLHTIIGVFAAKLRDTRQLLKAYREENNGLLEDLESLEDTIQDIVKLAHKHHVVRDMGGEG